MTIVRTCDLALVKALAIDPAIFPHISDDFAPEPELWQPLPNKEICYLVAIDDIGLFGFGAFIPNNWTCWRAHFGFLPRSYGDQALTAWKLMLDWIWANTRSRRIVGEISAENRRAIRFVQRAGFEIYGTNRGSWMKDGILRDQIALGVSKP